LLPSDYGQRKNYYSGCCTLPAHMTPTKLRERLEESEGRVDVDSFLDALTYVRDDGRTK